MRTDLLAYDLPHDRIAKYPVADRDGARMLVVRHDEFVDSTILDWPNQVPAGALVVVNDTRVLRARLLGSRRPTGGRVELLLLAPVEPDTGRETSQCWTALGRASKPLRVGTVIEFPSLLATVEFQNPDGELRVRLESDSPIRGAINDVGHVPIPPYLGRPDEPIDTERYQTIFADHTGSVAAPTAGLHLSQSILQSLADREIRVESITLHVGIGTFRPVVVSDLDTHPMHEESYVVSSQLAAQIEAARRRQSPVIAIGTTVVRALESAKDPARPGLVVPQSQTTRLLIQPGYKFEIVDSLLTNFHMPKSTLLALVGAFVGLDRILEAYKTALGRGYRFLSYGDATWIPNRL